MSFSVSHFNIPATQNNQTQVCNYNEKRQAIFILVYFESNPYLTMIPSSQYQSQFQLNRLVHGDMVNGPWYWVQVAGTAVNGWEGWITPEGPTDMIGQPTKLPWMTGIFMSAGFTNTPVKIGVWESFSAGLLVQKQVPTDGFVDMVTGEIVPTSNGKPKKNPLIYASVAGMLDRVAHRDSRKLSTRPCPDDKPIVARRQLETDPYAAAQAQIPSPVILDSESMVELYGTVPGGEGI